MTREENLLLTAMEESAEVQQAISKAMRFGLERYNPDSPFENNAESIMIEYYQLCAMIEMLQHKCVLPYFNDEKINKIMSDKIEKVERYQNVSESLGLISD